MNKERTSNEVHRTLVYDSQATGHHREYVAHLVRYWLEHEPAGRTLAIAGHPLLIDEMRETFPECSNRIDLFPIPAQRIKHLEKQSLWKRSLSEWHLLKKYARRYEADHCVLMHFNLFLVGVGLLGSGSTFSISGILFFPYVRIDPPTGIRWISFLHHLRRWRKRLLLSWAMWRSRVEKIFVLNDASAARQLNRVVDPKAERFEELPDPVPPLPQGAASKSLWERYDIASHRRLLLLFGTLSGRKGVLKALEAAAQLGEESAQATALLLLGRIKEEDRTGIETALVRAQANTSIQLRVDDRFVTPAEMASAFRECDAVLAPYQRTEGSSGVLGHAARAGKPVIGPESGLVGELIRTYELGTTVDATCPEAIREAFSAFANEKGQLASMQGMKTYVKERSPCLFARMMLGMQASHGALRHGSRRFHDEK